MTNMKIMVFVFLMVYTFAHAAVLIDGRIEQTDVVVEIPKSKFEVIILRTYPNTVCVVECPEQHILVGDNLIGEANQKSTLAGTVLFAITEKADIGIKVTNPSSQKGKMDSQFLS